MDSIRNPLKNSSNEDEENSVKISLSQHSLDEIQNLFEAFVEESKIDRVLSRFQPNVIKIYESLQKVLNNEADLYNKFLICKKDLNEINMKYAQALKLSNIDNKAKTDLLEELEKAWNQTSVAKSKEKRALETINSLKLEIFNLSKLVEQGVGLTMGQEYNLREILKEKERILAENTKLNEEILELRSEMEILAKKDDEYKRVIEESKVQVNQANQELLGCQLEIQKLTRKNIQLEEEIENQHRLNDLKESNLNKSNQSNQILRQEISKLEANVREVQLILEKNRKESEIQNNRYLKLQNEFDQLYLKMDSLSMENGQLIHEIKRKDELIETQKFENIQIQKMRDSFERKIKLLEDQKKEISNNKQVVELQIEKLKKLIDNLEKEKETKQKQTETLNIEKETVYLELKKSKNECANFQNQIKNLKNELESFRSDNLGLKERLEQLTKTIKNFDKERIRHQENLNEMNIKLNQFNEKLKLKDLEIFDSNRKYSILESKLRDVKRLYETTRADRNLYSKNFFKSKQEIKEVSAKIETHVNLESDLKKSLQKNRTQLKQLKTDNIEFRKNTEKLVTKLDKNENYLKNIESKIALDEKNEQKLTKIIENVEIEYVVLKNKNSKLEFEKNILGSQLIRRNDEISLLYEKIRLYEKILKRGEICYQNLENELKMVKSKLYSVKSQNDVLKQDRVLIRDLKKKLFWSDRDILLEKAKRNAVEKVQNSFIIHKWRSLQGYDPKSFELIMKCNILQKKLILKVEQLVSMQIKLSEKDRIFLEMKKFFSRRITTDEDMRMFQDFRVKLDENSKKLKTLLAENSMLSSVNDNLKSELEKSTQEAKDYKTNGFFKTILIEKIDLSLKNNKKPATSHIFDIISYIS
ncbi:cilia- and flagella-associated 58 [Brachionus plicatilis]|uniref:Cilia-and flagella-associated 58 n=1 Tax=Brachionus plicatilis TaxID=10195 RepID=A0A3M7S604_BRAPC|nr:cilia- and flagella-associated 58 [Brachionus plicatilis]